MSFFKPSDFDFISATNKITACDCANAKRDKAMEDAIHIMMNVISADGIGKEMSLEWFKKYEGEE